MTEEHENDIPVGTPPTWLMYIALSVGIISGFTALSSDTSDRYHASRAAQDFSLRDHRIERIEDAQREHLDHSAQYTQIIRRLERENEELKQRVSTLEREHARLLD